MSPAAVETPARHATQCVDIPTSQLWASPLNPRRTINPVSLKKLAASIGANGIIEPLVVRAKRQFDEGASPEFEIAAGERRWRAALLAKESPLPCIVRELTDEELVELALNENQQREEIHPLEEAEAIQQLLHLDPSNTISSVAAELGEDYAWVYDRLKLLRMSPVAQAAYRAGAIEHDHADILAHVPPHQQDAALGACFSELLYEIPEVEEDGEDTPYTVDDAIAKSRWDLLTPCLNSPASLRRWVSRHSTADIADQALQSSIPQLAEALEDAAADEAKLIQVSLDPELNETQAKALGVIRRARWIEIDEAGTDEPGRVSTSRCEHMRQAAVTHPVTPKNLRVVTICMKRSCPVHRPAPPKRPSSVSTVSDRDRKAAERRQQDEADRVERARVWNDEQRPKYLAALVALVGKVKTLSTTLVRALVDDYTIKEIAKNYGVTLTPQTALTVMMLAAAPTTYELNQGSYTLERFGSIFGLTPAQWLKAQKTAAKATKPAKWAKKAPAPKSTSKTTKKGGR